MKNLPDEDYFELIHSEEKMCGGFYLGVVRPRD
mgnify:CR=1 FL=1